MAHNEGMKSTSKSRSQIESMLVTASDAEIDARLAQLKSDAMFASGSLGKQVMRELLCWMELTSELKAVAA